MCFGSVLLTADIDCAGNNYAFKDSKSFVYGLQVAPGDDLDIENMETYFQVARDLGMSCIKIGVLWDKVIPNVNGQIVWKGHFEHPEARSARFSDNNFDYDKVAQLSRQYNISIFPAFLRSRKPERELDADQYTQFVYAFVRRYKEKMDIKYVEFHNEPAEANDGVNGGRKWSGTAEQLAHVTDTAYRKIKSKYPDIVIGSAGFCTGSWREAEQFTKPFYRHFLRAKPLFDFFALHDYPKELSRTQGTKPGDLVSTYHTFDTYRSLLDDNGYEDKPIFITEGYDDKPMFLGHKASWDWVDEDEASVLFLESYVHALSNEKKNKIIGKIISGIKSRPQTTMGLINKRDNRIRPQYYFVKYLVNLLQKYSIYSQRLAGEINSEDYWVEEFKNDHGKRMWIVFAPLNYETKESTNLQPAIFKKKMKYPQTFRFQSDTLTRISVSRVVNQDVVKEIKPLRNRCIDLQVGKKPIFIQEAWEF